MISNESKTTRERPTVISKIADKTTKSVGRYYDEEFVVFCITRINSRNPNNSTTGGTILLNSSPGICARFDENSVAGRQGYSYCNLYGDSLVGA